MTALHVLVVARWYPSFDDPGRGSFVADHVAALRDAGVAVTVASFDPTAVRGAEGTRPERGADAAVALAPELEAPEATSIPVSWGPGVPVARLPVILDGARRRPADVVEAHARALVPFGVGLHARRPIDVVHAHTGLPDGVAALRLADRLDLPLLTTEHASTAADELADPDASALYRPLLRRGRRVVAVSGSLALELAERLGFEPHEIAVVPNAVPLDAFPAGAPAGRDAHELLYVGSRKASKGIATLLRAFADVRVDDPEARLRLVGSPGTPEEEADWLETAERLGVADAVAFEARAERPAVAAAMRRADVFVHPSPRETFGVVAVEAIASGLPVAATPSGGVDEIVGADGRLGEIARDTGPAALAAAIRRVRAHRSSFDPDAMHAHVAASYAAPAIAARTLAIYERLMDEERPGSGQLAAEVVAGGGRGGGAASAGWPGVPEEAGPGAAIQPTAPAAPAAPTAPAVPTDAAAPPLVVGLVRELAASRLDAVPPELVARLTIVTLAEPEPRRAQPGRWLEHEPEREYLERLDALGGPLEGSSLGRLLSAVRSPRRGLARRELIGRRAAVRRASLDSFLLAAWGSAGRPQFVLALDADDVLAVGALLDEGARLAPGGLRWLVDRWDEAASSG